jgi:hypothetical protein
MRIEKAYTVFDKQTGKWLAKSPGGTLNWVNEFKEAYLFKSLAAPRTLLGAYLQQDERYVLQELEAQWVVKRQGLLTL